MRPSVRSHRRVSLGAAALALIVIGLGDAVPAQQQIVPGNNVNMVSGTTLPDGDPYLQRQNEPSSAVSTANPLHILGGANDYRTVDIPHPSDLLRPQRMNADAWVGIFKSLDGGQNWKSTLLPGYPQDPARTAPLWGYDAATDPFMRAGTSGMFYFAGLAFDRGDSAPSAIFVARFIDMNNLEAGDPIVHLNTRIVDSDQGGRFLDKTALATDIPRTAATCSFNVPLGDEAGTVVARTIPAGNVYVAYSAFTGSGAAEQSVIMFSRSTDCGTTWRTPIALSAGSQRVQNAQIAVNPVNGHVYVTWRRFRYLSQDDAVMVVRSTDGGATFGRPTRVAGMRSMDQPTSLTSFRSNGFQTMAFDGTGRAYLAWAERGHATLRPDPVTGDARVVVSTSTNGTAWTVPRPVQSGGLGHQLMPVLSFHAGRLRLLYYDLREDFSSVFAPFVDEFDVLAANSTVRHTVDVFVAQASPGAAPTFTTARLSDYAFGFVPGSNEEQRLQFNPPNLPLFRQGTTPFMGDYIDLAPAPAFVQNPDGAWVHNTAGTNAVSHAFWTDNRDVRPPADGDWANYTALGTAQGQQSQFDPGQTLPGCRVGQAGMRNQNIYTARVGEGLFVSAPGNNKPLGDFQRAFVVVAENATDISRNFRLSIDGQPVGGEASFLQFSPLTILDVTVPPFSSVARTVFASSTDENARINVSIVEITAPGGTPILGGLSGSVVLNPDPQAPRLQNPRLQNPRLQNPLISEAEAYNAGITNAVFAVPRLQNPRLQNPSILNPRLQNDSLGNPRLQNDAVANPGVVSVSTANTELENPRLQNPRLQNPRLQNESLVNAGFSDTSWSLTNDGNTTAAYTINLVLNEAIPTGFASQLLIHKTTTTPAANGCDLAEQLHTILVANIPDPEFVPISDVANPRLQNPRLQNPTLALAPGESATVTLRIVDPNRFDGVAYDASGAVTPAAVAQSVNSEDVAAGSTTPPVAIPLTITTTALAPVAPGAAYSQSLQSIAGAGALSCSVIAGSLPPGLSLSPGGTIAGTPTTPGNYRFTVRCVDANGVADEQPLFLQIDPSAPVGFNRVWNGADTDWSNPDNWSPRGVPEPTDRVYVAGAITVVPTLTRDVIVRDLFVEPGSTVNTNGFGLTVTGTANAGPAIIGNGTTVLTGDGATATGVFSNLEIRGRIVLNGPVSTTGSLTLAAGASLYLNGQSLIVGGQLVSNVTEGAAPVVAGPSTSFLVSGVAVNGLVVQAAPLTVNGGTLTQFDNVAFTGFAPEAIQLTINHPGPPDSFVVNGLSFSTDPTTGRLVQANDTQDGGNTLVIDIFGAVPADGSADTGTTGGAVVNWVFNPGEANLSVVQSVLPVPAAAGTPLTYTIRVRNGGPAAATGVTLNPGVPPGATGVTATTTQGTCAVSAGGGSCALGTIPAGAEVVATVSFVPPGVGTLLTTASVTANEADSVQANNSHVVAATIIPAGASVSLSIAKTDSVDPVAPGAPFTYSIAVTNAGTTVATGVQVVDPIPAGVTIVGPSSTQGTCAIAAGQVQCSLGTLNPGQIVTITLPASASVPGLVSNSAFVTSTEPELSPSNNVASQQTMVVETTGCTVAAFSGPVSFAGSPGPTAVVRLVDMDHDGDLDAVATHEINTGGVDVWLNNGTGQFAAPRFTSTQTGPWIHVVADFNGDTHPDVISSSDRTAVGNPLTLRFLTNDGTGALTHVPTFSIPFGGHLDALDLDRDGDQDLVIVTAAGDLALLRNDGTANFAAPVTIHPGPIAGFTAFGDFNADSRTDVAIALGTAGYAVALANATGGFLPPVAHAVTGGAHAVAPPADLNGDGHLDLVITEGDEDEPSAQASVALGDGAGGFGAAVDIAPGFVYAPTLTDVNGDGRVDLVSLSSFNSFAVRLGDGVGGFTAPVHFPNGVYYGPTVGDLNGDSRPDIAIGDRNGRLNVFFNNCGASPANLSVSVSESADPVNEGDELTYTVTVTNQTATEATGVRVTSVLSPESSDDPEEPNVTVLATTSSAGGTLATFGSTYTWTLPMLAANSTATFQFQFRPLSGATLLFTSGATSDGAETDPSDNTASASTTVTGLGRTIEITTTADSGPGSLRQAIDQSNSDTGDVDRIVFNIGGGGPQTIVPLTPLPAILQPAIVDGTTQPGFNGAPIIELNGNGLNANGLALGGGVTVRGLVINRFGQSGILMFTPGGGNVIEGNYIGLNVAGTAPLPNNQGVAIFSAGNRVGGPTVAARNIISGNTTSAVAVVNATATGNLVQGNYIGTNVNGTAAVPNQGVQSGIHITNGASTNSVLGNVVSGNTQHAVTVFGTTTNGNVIQGNLIGTDPSGLIRLANGGIGVDVVSASNTVVGGAGAARNIISGNNTGMQLRTGATGTLVQNNYIGVAASGTAAISNNLVGITINDGARANIIGGATAGLRNLISGNTGAGISLVGALTTDNVIIGNSIGAGATTATPLPNQNNGITIDDATNTRIGGPAAGEGNIIAFNTGHGVTVFAGTGNRISNNAMSDNGLIGINLGAGGVTANDAGDADLGGNNLQNFPVLTSAVDNGTTLTVQGTLNSLANTTFRIEIFGNAAADVTGFGEGATPLGFVNVTTDGAGNATFSTTVPDTGTTVLSATAEFDGNTSEFSAVLTVTAAPPTFVVVNTNDSGAGSLRQAIINSNATPGATDTISFNIPGGGVHTITPTIALPAILSPVIIDATTQPGYSGAPLIELNGVTIEAGGTNGLTVTGGGTTIRGFAINRFTGHGILISTGGANVVEANYLGTNAAGTLASANGDRGIFINVSGANRIGGLTAAQRNVISGNAVDGVTISGGSSIGNVVQGNYVGTNAAGTAAIPNQSHGVAISNASINTIGGTAAGAGNVLSGNSSNGVGMFDSSGNTVAGNIVGLNAAATGIIANGIDGIGIVRAPNNIVRNNTVGGNARMGVGIFENAAFGNMVQANRIGTTVAAADVGNGGDGVHISTAGSNTIGGGPGNGNTIAFNTGRGINVVSGTGNRLSANSIFANDLIGIDLNNNGVTANDAGDGDGGANNLQNFPVLTSAVPSGSGLSVQGTLNSTPNTTFAVEIFAGGADPSGFGEGATLLATFNVTTDAAGAAAFTTEVPNVANSLTATATNPTGNTSEFSAVLAVAASPQTFTVTNTNDSGAGSLRQAIISSNETVGARDTIAFNIPGVGPHTIAVLSPLPIVTDPVTIDGTTEPDFAGTPVVELDGTSAGGSTNGIWLRTLSSVVRGLVINRFGTGGVGGSLGGAGVVIETLGSNVVEGNFIGTDVSGTLARPNREDGVWVDSDTNRIGGTSAAQRNVISGNGRNGVTINGVNAHHNLIVGNYIGTDSNGTGDVGNTARGVDVFMAAQTTVGGTVAGSRNVIAGNGADGLTLGFQSSAATVQGNYIGTNAAGTTPIPNTLHGVAIVTSANNIIGGAVAGAENLISGNTLNGVGVFETASAGNRIEGNSIGTNAALDGTIANGVDGVGIVRAPNNTVVNNTVGGNVRMGVAIFEGTATGNLVQTNRIGLTAGSVDIGNGSDGVHISLTASGNTIGGGPSTGNFIAFNGGHGINVVSGTGNRLATNRIFDNDLLGIDLGANGVTPNDVADADTGANNLQNFPVLTSAISSGTNIIVEGTLNSTPNTTFRVELFAGAAADASGFGEGANLIAGFDVTTDANGAAEISVSVLNLGASVTATATSPDGNTSEFSAAVTVTGAPEDATITATDATAAELGGDAATFVVSRPSGEATTAERSVTVTIGGTATVFTDYLVDSPLLTFGSGFFIVGIPAGQSSAVVTVTPVFQPTVEGSETVIFTAEGSSATATIADEPAASVAVTDATAAELDNTATFVVSRGAGASTTAERSVTVTIGGTATVFTDYLVDSPLLTFGSGFFIVGIPAGQSSAVVTVTPVFQPTVEGSETVIFTAEGSSATATIADEPAATIGVTDATASELGDTATLVVSRGAGASTTAERQVTVTIGGTATVFTDYLVDSPLLTFGSGFFIVGIPAGQLSAIVTVSPNPDGATEGPETVIFTAEGTSATATIADAPGSTQRTWIADADGLWDNPANWSGGVVPQPGEDVIIDRPGSFNITLQSTTSIASLTSQERLTILAGSLTSSGQMTLNGGLTMSGGAINGAGDLVLGGTSTWTSGQVIGTGSIVVTALAGLSVSSPGQAGVLQRNFTNAGAVTWNQASLTLSGLSIVNQPGGVFEIQSNLPISNGTISNAGTLFKSGPVGPITLSNVAFATSGSLDLRIAGATTFDSIQSDGIGGVDGNLSVSLQGGFTPTGGTPFGVLTFGTLSGTFAAINGNGQDYAADYSGTTLTLVAEVDNIVLSLVDTTLVGVGRQATLRVTLPSAAPSGGVTVAVSSDNTNLLTVASPGTVAIAQGQTVGDILVTGVQPGPVTITAQAPGYSSGQLPLTVTQNLISTPGALNVPFGQSIALPVSIGPSPAPPGGLTLSVVSSNPAIVEVLTPQITVAEGAFSANATVRGAQIGAVLVTVSNPEYSPSTTSVTSSAELNILLGSVTFNSALPAPALTVRLESSGTPIAAQQAITVNLVSGNPACVTVAATSTIPNGQVTTTFTPAYGGTAPLPCTTTVTASATGLVSDSISITVDPQSNITAPAAVIVGSRLMVGTGASLGTTQHGGVTVTVTSSDPTRVLLSRNSSLVGQASITVPMADGQSFVPYVVHGVENTTGSATVTLSSPGFVGDSHLATVAAIGVELHDLDPTMSVIGGEDANLYVQVGIPNAQGTALASVQQVRAGSPLVVTLTNSNSVVGQLRSDEPALTAQTVTKPIQPGIYFSLANGVGTAWGLAFQPLAGGNTTVTATGPPGVLTMTTTGVRQVVVSGSGSITPPGTVVVGSRLMTSTAVVLSAANHGGVTVTVTSSNPAMALVSAAGTTVGTTSANVVVPNGQSFVQYFVHGTDNVTGTATFTVSVPGFGTVDHQVDVVASGVEIVSLDSPTSTEALEDTDWYVQVGIPNAQATALSQIQFVRPGAPLVVTLTNTDDAVGQLRSDQPAATGQIVTKPIQPGIYFTQAVALGTSWGLGFDALVDGSTTVTVTGPAGVLTMSQTGVRQVVVQESSITPPGTTVVGARLMTATGASLGAAGHGGIDVTFTSSDPTRVLLAPDLSTTGQASINVPVPNGQAFVTYYLLGVPNTTGTATVTISAPGFGEATHQVQVVPAGVEIVNLVGTISNLSAEHTNWYVQVGIPNNDGTSLSQVQVVQPGSPFVVTLSNSNATVARLRSDEPPLIAQSVTKPIQPGIYFTVSATFDTSWGLAFDPLANGSTTVTVTGPAGVQTMTQTGVRPVVVGTPGIEVQSTATVAAGLQLALGATLGGSQHGGVDVLITSSAPGLLRVSPDGTTPGDADGSITVPVPVNQTGVSFVLQALENVSGTAIVTLSAPGFTTSTITVTVTAAGIEIVGLPPTIQAAAGEYVSWYVQAGIPNQDASGLTVVQNVRAGSPGFVVTLTSNNAAASLRSDQPVASGQTVTKPIQPGIYFTQPVSAGTSFGLGFTPLTAGTVVVSASGPAGVVATDQASRTVVIQP